MSRTALWIVGPPAAGKTTLVRGILGAEPLTIIERPKWSVAFGGEVVAAGHYTGDTFDGADRIGYNQIDATLEYWRDHLRAAARLTVFDGDRFSHAGAVEFVRAYVDAVHVCYLSAPDAVLAERRAARNWSPDPTWLKGRVTKAQRFAEGFE